MANEYDKINKLKEKHKKEIEEKDNKILALEEKVKELDADVQRLRQELFDAGAGKGHVNKLKRELTAKERENKTLENQIRELDGSKLISTFSDERQQLIRNIRNLKFNNSKFNSLAKRFNNGLDDVIELAALIKKNYVADMDFYTYMFRDNIVGLLEKMLKAVIQKQHESASKYLVNLVNGNYQFPKHYTDKIPNLKSKKVLQNILDLLNMQTVGYHGTKRKYKKVYEDSETQEIKKTDNFLNLSNDDQLDAIFTLLEFMYDVFINKDHEVNLLAICNSWFTTIS